MCFGPAVAGGERGVPGPRMAAWVERWSLDQRMSTLQGALMNSLKAIAAAACLLAAAQANAISFTVTSGAMSLVEGVSTDTFDADATVSLNPTGGAFFSASVSNISAQPPGSTGQWWSIGTSGEQGGPGTVQLNAGATYYGFLWGSPDGYNSVEFYSDGTLLQSFGGAGVFAQADGFQGNFPLGQYVNFWAGEGERFDQVRFISLNNAFETDNHAVFADQRISILTSVPEPETYALLLAGVGVVGFMARRRRPN